MAENTIDPRPVEPGSISEAQNAFLGILEPEEAKPEAEASEPTEVEESTEETQDESLDEVSEELEEESEVEEDSDEDSEEESEEEEEVEELYTVTVNGEQLEVTQDELIKGYSRQSDYTKKTQEIAEYRKQAEAVAQQAQQEVYQTQQFRQQYIDAASAVVEQQYGRLNNLVNNTDWERLKIEDREEYLTKKSEVSDLQAQMQQDQAGIQQAQEQAAQEQQHMQAQIAQQERTKLEQVIPEWKDPKFRQAVSKDISEFAMSQGFTSEELSQLTDHRSLIILMQAKAFQEMQKAQQSTKTKKKVKTAKMVKSGTGGKKKDEKAKVKRTAQMKRLKESGHVNDSVSLFEDFVDI